MIIRLLLAIAVVVFLFWLSNKWRRLPDDRKKSTLVKWLLLGAALAVIAAVATGRMHWLGAVFAGLITFGRYGLGIVLRALPFLRLFRSSSLINNPRFKTPYLDLRIDLKTFQLYGTIIGGPHEGAQISTLGPKELEELEQFYEQNNKASMYLIRVIRQRGNNHQTGPKDYSSSNNPSIEEAYQVLGLSEQATKKDIIKSHRSLMQKLHPDRGGNDYLASRINLAKDVLLNYLEKKAPNN